jgi:hypothetical protein
MAKKFMTKYMVAKMGLVIFILIEVQANGIPSTSLQEKSIPIESPPFKGSVYMCMKTHLERCEDLEVVSS